MTLPFDTQMMSRALQLARRGRYWAAPNPHVGCVLVRDGAVIGEGFTQPAGGHHAEVVALGQAGDARGATAYVTLEPCAHQGRTGPCADALIAAGVSTAHVALADPNPLVSGRGLQKLRDAGITVHSGEQAAQARALIEGFVLRMTRGYGRIRVKLAMSLDGRTAMASGESQWITGPSARQDVQRLRAASCAIVTGVDTVLADDCSLTVRPGELGLGGDELARASARAPLRVVLDSKGRTPPQARVLAGPGPAVLLHGPQAPVGVWPSTVSVETLALGADGLDLDEVVKVLGGRQCNEILVESGPRLAGALLQAGLLDEMVIYMAPVLMGDLARPLLSLPLAQMAQKIALQITDVRRVGEDYRLTAMPVKSQD